MPAATAPAPWQRHVALRYAMALIAVAAAVGLRGVLEPWLDAGLPFLLVFGAVALAVWFGGTGPGVLAAAVGFVAHAALFIDRDWLWGPWGVSHAVTLASYAFSTGLIILFGRALLASRRQCEDEIAQRRVAQEATLGERRRLEITLASIGDGVLVCDTEGRVDSLNPVAQQLTGWSQDEARGRSLHEVLAIAHETTGEPVDNPALRALKEGVIVSLANHTVLCPREGAAIPIEDSASPIVDDEGRTIGAVLVFRDARAQREYLSERLRIEASLRQSDATLRAFFDNAPAGIGVVELTDDGDIVHLQDNPVTCRIFGVPPGATVQRRASELGASAEMIALWRTYYLQSATLKQPIAFEYSQQIEGATLRYRATVCCVGDDAQDAGAPMRFCYMAEDITQRHATASRLMESEAQARLALDIARLGTWSWDVLADVVRADARTREIVGLPDAASAPGFRLADVVGRIHDGDWARVEASLSAAVRPDSDGRYAEEFRFAGGSDESARWVLAHGQALYDPDDPVRRVTRVLGSLLDITERKRAEEMLAEADRRKDEFIATLAHELRNPLAPLRNGVHLLRILIGQEDGADAKAASVAKPLAIMERQITHMVRLIDDLLDVGRVSGGKLELQRHRIDIADAVREAVETSQPLIQAAGHRLTVVLPTQPVFVDADVTRLCQVVANLLNNAAKYTAEGGRIRVSVEVREPGWVELRVEDNGRGLASEMLPKIFQMFAQVDREVGRSAGGLGIGLAIARKLVQMHGGDLRAASAGLGQGSSFVVRLPRAGDGVGPAAARALDLQCLVTDRQGRLLTGCQVLIADDNVDAADSLNNLLHLMGCATRVAHDGAEAYRLAEAQHPDIALLDIGMPELDGNQLARKIRAQPWGQAIKLVAVTGWGQEADLRASAEAGFDLHWVKPVDPAALDALVDSVATARAMVGTAHSADEARPPAG